MRAKLCSAMRLIFGLTGLLGNKIAAYGVNPIHNRPYRLQIFLEPLGKRLFNIGKRLIHGITSLFDKNLSPRKCSFSLERAGSHEELDLVNMVALAIAALATTDV